MSDPTNRERRTNGDRRNASRRRRHAESRRVYIELCHSVLRIAIVLDDDSKELPTLKTRSVRWRQKAADLQSEQGQAELTAALRTLVTNEKLVGCSVSLAISSTLCVNRATSGNSALVEQEISDLQERSQLYLSLGPGMKTAAVGRKQIDARHEHALVTVANENTLNRLVDAAESAGLVIEVVESALVALSRLHGAIEPSEESAVLLAQLDEDRFEIGVSRSGQLLLEYRPPATATIARLGEVVDDHYDRLFRYCARQYGVGSMKIDRMWLVGDPEEVSGTNATNQSIADCRVMPLDRLSELWRLPEEGSVTAEMGATLGLALRNRYDENGVSPNLMDDIHARAKTPIRPVLLRSLAPLAATLLAAASLWVFNLEKRSELTALRAEYNTIRPVELRGKQLTKRLIDATTEAKHVEDLVASTPRRAINPVVADLGACLPEDVWLKSLRVLGDDHAAVSGASYTESGVYDFVRYLETSPNFKEVALRGTGVDQTPQGPATSFDIDLELAQATLASEEAGS